MTTPPPEQVEEQLKVFDLKPGATFDEIKKRRVFLTKQMHEDNFAPQFKQQSREKMIEIDAAWEVINAWFKANPNEKATPKSSKPEEKQLKNEYYLPKYLLDQ